MRRCRSPKTEDQAPVEPDAEPTPPPPSQPVIRPVVVPKDWRGVFSAIRAGDWASAQAGINALPDDILKPVARAELFTARNSPRVGVAAAARLARRGARFAPGRRRCSAWPRRAAPSSCRRSRCAARMVPLGSAPRRHRSRPVQGDLAADALRTALEPLVKTDCAQEAEALYVQALPTLTPEGRAEAAQRVAWIYYVLGRDADARRVAETASEGAIGEWVSQANWIAGLASWRMNDCNAAARHFRAVATGRSEARTGRGRRLLGGALGAGLPAAAAGRALAEGRGAVGGELLRPARPRDAGHGQVVAGRSACPRPGVSNVFPMSGEPCGSRRSVNIGLRTRCFGTRRRSARRRTISP